MAERPLRWGLLGASRIARKFSADLRSLGRAPAAVASRDEARARAFALAENVPTYHASYQALLDDASVDAVYISLPNHLHAEWSVRAARAGKHVLCEKPGALDEAECLLVIEAARRARVFYMEGFMYRCHPLWDFAKAVIAEGAIGRVQRLESYFCYDMGFKPDNIRQQRDAGGGALLDVGCYCLSFSRLFAGEEPSACAGETRVHAQTRVDEWTRAELVFPSGVTADFECALALSRPHAAVIHGDKGRLEIPSPWHPNKDRAALRILVPGAEAEEYHAGDGLPLFAREIALAEEYLDDGECPAMTWADSLGQARALESLRKKMGLI